MTSGIKIIGKREGATLLVGTTLGVGRGRVRPTAPATPRHAPSSKHRALRLLRCLADTVDAVRGSERLDPRLFAPTPISRPARLTRRVARYSAQDLYATERFTDVVITGAENGNLVITVRENPVINRMCLKATAPQSDKICRDQARPPPDLTRPSPHRRRGIVELYRREGRFAARV